MHLIKKPLQHIYKQDTIKTISMPLILLAMFTLTNCKTTSATANIDSSLKRSWWMMQPQNCAYIGSDKSSKPNSFHPVIILIKFPTCTSSYRKDIDLLHLDCSKSTVKRSFFYSYSKQSCQFHKREFSKFDTQF